jgi:hypothetical protein
MMAVCSITITVDGFIRERFAVFVLSLRLGGNIVSSGVTQVAVTCGHNYAPHRPKLASSVAPLTKHTPHAKKHVILPQPRTSLKTTIAITPPTNTAACTANHYNAFTTKLTRKRHKHTDLSQWKPRCLTQG